MGWEVEVAHPYQPLFLPSELDWQFKLRVGAGWGAEASGVCLGQYSADRDGGGPTR